MQKDQGFHRMLREILEEPTALRETLASVGSSCKRIVTELAREDGPNLLLGKRHELPCRARESVSDVVIEYRAMQLDSRL